MARLSSALQAVKIVSVVLVSANTFRTQRLKSAGPAFQTARLALWLIFPAVLSAWMAPSLTHPSSVNLATPLVRSVVAQQRAALRVLLDRSTSVAIVSSALPTVSSAHQHQFAPPAEKDLQ